MSLYASVPQLLNALRSRLWLKLGHCWRCGMAELLADRGPTIMPINARASVMPAAQLEAVETLIGSIEEPHHLNEGSQANGRA
jgi:hypothetical protein